MKTSSPKTGCNKQLTHSTMTTDSSNRTPSTAVIQAVAACERVEPVDLMEPLSEAINPDGLNAVCRASTVHITFEYHGYIVTIDADNQVDLAEIA